MLVILFIAACSSVFAQTRVGSDSIKVAVEPAYDSVGHFHRVLLGESYRKLWAEPVTLKIFRLNKEKGGLKIEQRGGGMQTKSLRLKDPNGQEWVLRTIQKYPEKVLPPNLRKTIAKDIIQDQISAEHPFSALVVPPLAQALGIPHAHPQIVYVPDDPAFGKYRKDFANQVFLFEEREPLDADKTDNTEKVEKKIQEDNDTHANQALFLRARLLDFLLGDWDRHEDQWRWEKKTDSLGGTVYEPVPRDRDQVFYGTSGVLPWLVSRHLLMSKFQSFQDHIRSINRWNLNGRNVDRYFLNSLSEQDWEMQIKYVQGKLTDQLITEAMKKMPPNIYRLCGRELTRKLIGRRNILMQQAIKYYRFISQIVEIPGSDKKEQFDLSYANDGRITLQINKIKKDGGLDQVLYNRTFDPGITNEIRLYGLAGEDKFIVHGSAHSTITVRMIGGDDEDIFAFDKDVDSKNNRYIYDRKDQKNSLPLNSQAHFRLSADTGVNKFDKKDFKYNFLQPLVLGSYNSDYGVQLMTDFIYQKQGFRKDPYAFRQSLLVNYGFGASSLLLNYTGEFKQVFGKSDLLVNILSKGPNYQSYFFGLGNNTQYINEGSYKRTYYRNVYNFLNADVRIRHVYNDWTVSGGVVAQYYNGDKESNNNRFLNDYAASHPDEKVFATGANVGLVAGLSLDSRSKGIIPHDGILWNTTLTGLKSLNSNSHTYGQVVTDFTFFVNPDRDSVFIVSNRTGGGTTIGNASFYQQLQLGGINSLRGFYTGRFTGKSMVYNNLELRLKLFDYTSYIVPGTLGLVAFNDVGRVWSPGESSNQWHDGYGGGFYLIPAQLILVQAVVGFSNEGAYPYISAGFKF
ncbi:BamA/TamA family outer membrane protein [Mucilaginibacter sp. L3T2-6]|uniref:BamA/TamA family outer membrane protein n=1 Tax=Mucilaginibacter sp. L3T2-6 TaxID=3062491 RepID=UPI002674DCA8|nr:BamA/TamA family outer membrane protein [Mucilaginibacter sp. L3T2-6]MDO3640853.1 BamA/TamA family outer membrane protein [Mucilaginibacter sp. L3T2-6]MDV6213671.1 BamA/TamA family outer membrane protein [Mucilaginibacter sp. L3T2-6]